jgi:hypothetical protein
MSKPTKTPIELVGGPYDGDSFTWSGPLPWIIHLPRPDPRGPEFTPLSPEEEGPIRLLNYRVIEGTERAYFEGLRNIGAFLERLDPPAPKG